MGLDSQAKLANATTAVDHRHLGTRPSAPQPPKTGAQSVAFCP